MELIIGRELSGLLLLSIFGSDRASYYMVVSMKQQGMVMAVGGERGKGAVALARRLAAPLICGHSPVTLGTPLTNHADSNLKPIIVELINFQIRSMPVTLA